jgi:aminoglycoside phosphotransferase (APT) family kinase protein
MTADGTREILSFIPGETGYPPMPELQRSAEALVSVTQAIRAMHDAGQGFIPADPQTWHGHEVAVPARIDCIGHHDLAPWNIVFDRAQVVGIIDWDSAGPSNRAWDLSYAAYHDVPLSPPSGVKAAGWKHEPDRAARLGLLTDTYGLGIEPAEILDLVVVRLTSMAAHIEQQIRAGNPDFDEHRDEKHGDGYRKAGGFILANREAFLS